MTPEYPFFGESGLLENVFFCIFEWLACPSRRRAQLPIPGRMQVPCCVGAAQNYVATSSSTTRNGGAVAAREISQSVSHFTTLLPTEHMVHVYTHSVLNECVAESQSRGGGLTARTCRHPACTGQHVWPARRYTHVTYVSRRIPKPLAEHPEQGAASKRRNVSPAGIPAGVACRVAA